MTKKKVRHTPSEFLDALQEAVVGMLDSEDEKTRLLALKEGINLAKVRHGIDEEEDGDGMGFAQR